MKANLRADRRSDRDRSSSETSYSDRRRGRIVDHRYLAINLNSLRARPEEPGVFSGRSRQLPM